MLLFGICRFLLISGTIFNTNMYLEAFHRVLKDCYMDKKKNRRVDNLLFLLMQVVNDKVFDRLRMIVTGARSAKLSGFRKRHKKAAACASDYEFFDHVVAEKPCTVVGSQNKEYCVIIETDVECDCLLRYELKILRVE